MKEWCLKHPIMTFLVATGLIDGVVKVVKIISIVAVAGKIPAEETVEEGEENNESTNDIQ